MNDQEMKEKIINALEGLEHPEIASTLVDLNMIHEVTAENDSTVNIVLAFPMLGIPQEIKQMIASSVSERIEPLGLTINFLETEMNMEDKEAFFAAAKTGWKL